MDNYPKNEYHDQPPAYSDHGYTSGNNELGFKTQGQVEPTAPSNVYIQPNPSVLPQIAQPSVIYVGVPMRFGDSPTQTMCPNCRANILTNIQYETGLVTWLIAGGLCFFGLWCGCCLIPFCSDSCKDTLHFCPNCRHLIGRNKKL